MDTRTPGDQDDGPSGGRREDGFERVERPWWGSPITWLGVCAVFALLGLVVAPRLFGGVFLFLPLIWIGRWGRRDHR